MTKLFNNLHIPRHRDGKFATRDFAETANGTVVLGFTVKNEANTECPPHCHDCDRCGARMTEDGHHMNRELDNDHVAVANGYDGDDADGESDDI